MLTVALAEAQADLDAANRRIAELERDYHEARGFAEQCKAENARLERWLEDATKPDPRFAELRLAVEAQE